METKNSTNQSCENCRHYAQHYTKHGIKLITVYCGHCMNAQVRKTKRKPLELCEFWEEITIKKEECRESVKKTIETIAERLERIAMILESDVEN